MKPPRVEELISANDAKTSRPKDKDGVGQKPTQHAENDIELADIEDGHPVPPLLDPTQGFASSLPLWDT
jgi:hypothetical protein